jgi:iron complex outermembrane receptor protein
MYQHAKLALMGGISLVAFATQALAQETAAAEEDRDNSEIVVTGTLIKGVAPVGSDVIGISAQDVLTSGVTNATDLLRKIPQVGDFNSIPQPTTNSSVPFSPIQLRGIGGLSGMATLILIDGKRIVPTSPQQNWIDTQMIPAGIIERVEVVADGGSSIYGSDAVAGVVNFVTRRRAKGITVSGSYGDGKGGFSFWDAAVTAGHEWSSGSFVLSYAYSNRKTLLGRDLDYLTENKTAFGGQDNRAASCAPGTITANGTTYALPARVPGSQNRCSAFDRLSYYPAEQRHSVFGTLTQELFAGGKLEVNAFWSRRSAQVSDPDNARSSGTITSANPYFSPVAGETSQDIAFSYENAFGIRENPSVYEAYQISPTLTVELSPKWTARLGFNYGRSNSSFDTYRVNSAAQSIALASAVQATALNPYNPSASSPAVVGGIADYIEGDRSHQEIQEARLVFDGSLFELPAGAVKVAFGGELRKEIYNYFRAQGPAANLVTVADSQRDRLVSSVFGEVYVPLLDNLRVSLSGRYDHYDDVGSTTNPKVGFTFEPTKWVSLRGSWGTSFHAPSMADLSAPQGYGLFLPISPFRAANSPFPDFFKPTFIVGGAATGIAPEKATTWSLGADFKPMTGLRFGLTYWNINYKDRIDQNAGFFFGPGYYSDPVNQSYYILNPGTPQDIINKFGNLPVLGFPNLQTLYAIFGAPYVVSDQRKQNMGGLKLDGIDFNVNYDTDLAGGTVRLGLNGTYLLSRQKENVRGSGFYDTLALGDFNTPISRVNLTGSMGWAKGPFDANLTVYHRGSGKVGAERIDSFTTVSLFGKYNITSNISATVNVDNLFDAAPPFRLVTNGVAYIDPGRVVKLGVSASF